MRFTPRSPGLRFLIFAAISASALPIYHIPVGAGQVCSFPCRHLHGRIEIIHQESIIGPARVISPRAPSPAIILDLPASSNPLLSGTATMNTPNPPNSPFVPPSDTSIPSPIDVAGTIQNAGSSVGNAIPLAAALPQTNGALSAIDVSSLVSGNSSEDVVSAVEDSQTAGGVLGSAGVPMPSSAVNTFFPGRPRGFPSYVS